MCGLAGFFRVSGSEGLSEDLDCLEKMGKSIVHRGPDHGGTYIDNTIGLVHRRLSILDLSDAGNQPMVSDSGRYVIVFNGEIYNFKELRKELENDGVVFQTHTDTEVLLRLYERESEHCLKRLNGMFAFAIWDKEQGQLFLARDRLGKKPLYFYHADGNFAFGSELKAIFPLPFVKRRIRPDAVKDFFAYQYVPDPKTIYQDIHKLGPGYWLKTDGRTIDTRQYWDLDFSTVNPASLGDIKGEVLDLISDAVRLRMVSDVPLGAFLSGGIDSSGIVGLMASHTDTPVTTCSIGFDSEKYDEVQYARQVANQFGTDHHEFTVQEDVASHFNHIASYFDEPFADPSFIPTYFVSKLARQKVTVALAGDGGDENFAGYEKYYVDAIENKLRKLVPRGIRHSAFPYLSDLFAGSEMPFLRKARSLLRTLSTEADEGFYGSNCFFDPSVWNHIVAPGFEKETDGYDPSSITCHYYRKAPADDHLSRILYTDFKTYLPGDILVKVDRMSMANSLETRAPLLDYRVVEYAAGIPSALKLKGNQKKFVLKEAFSEMLSDDILYRKKMGFSVPLAQWLRTELREFADAVFQLDSVGLSDIFRMERVRDLWQAHLSGDSRFTQELWTMLMFAVWVRRYES
jgi:asparagine synthase (glutamine-hydrolysing)